MLLADRLPARRLAARLAFSRSDLTPFQVVFVGSFLAYLLAAVVLVLGFHSIVGDAWSRVGNAYYMLFSRDPHLAAIGFVWGPLPSLLVLPLLPFARIWPDLAATGFAGSIVSALCMAGAAWEIWGSAADWGVGRRTQAAITALFVFNPMIVYYAANGMSEAIFLLTLIVAARYLARWFKDGQWAALVVSGLALALGYLTRYEAIPGAIGAGALVGGASALRAAGTRRHRLIAGAADATVLLVPAIAAFVGFAFASLLIVGNAFEQFTSVYGLSSQMAVEGAHFTAQTGQGTAAGYGYIARQVIGLSPAVLLLAPLALFVAGRRPNAAAYSVLATLGAVVAWAVFGFVTGRTLGWLRYSIAVIPLDCMLAAAMLGARPGRLPAIVPAPPNPVPRSIRMAVHSGIHALAGIGRIPGRAAGSAGPPAADGPRAILRRIADPRSWATLLVVGSLVVSIPIGTLTMLDERNNPSEGGEGFLLRPLVHIGPRLGTISPTGQYDVSREVAGYLDSLDLRDGQVLVDVSSGFPIVLMSSHPRQFVITTDRDFQAVLGSPETFGVRFLLVPEDTGYARLDALNRTYPGLYAGTAGIGRLARTFSTGGYSWRLYELDPSAPG